MANMALSGNMIRVLYSVEASRGILTACRTMTDVPSTHQEAYIIKRLLPTRSPSEKQVGFVVLY